MRDILDACLTATPPAILAAAVVQASQSAPADPDWNRLVNVGLAVIANVESLVDQFDPADAGSAVAQPLVDAATVLRQCAVRWREHLRDMPEAEFLGLNAALLLLYAGRVDDASAVATEVSHWQQDDIIYGLVAVQIRDRGWQTRLGREVFHALDMTRATTGQRAIIYRYEQALAWLDRLAVWQQEVRRD